MACLVARQRERTVRPSNGLHCYEGLSFIVVTNMKNEKY